MTVDELKIQMTLLGLKRVRVKFNHTSYEWDAFLPRSPMGDHHPARHLRMGSLARINLEDVTFHVGVSRHAECGSFNFGYAEGKIAARARPPADMMLLIKWDWDTFRVAPHGTVVENAKYLALHEYGTAYAQVLTDA